MKSFLHLTDPLVLGGQWTHHWFDISRQQMLLFRDNSFFVWSPCSADPGPREIFSDPTLPSKIVYAKISMDGKLIVVQSSKSSMIVLDVANKKRWKVDIKYMSGNEILENGLIWSEHGGNSQDLVIVTSRGLELYKVSIARAQCKLSRYISIRIQYFWFEPNFRAIMTAVSSKDSSLEMSGFFLRFDMSDMPRLELPPPDRMPALTLPHSASPQGIAMVTLYGSLYCVVRYEEQGGDLLCLYHLSHSKVQKSYTFPLYVSSPIKISVTDNILCCHCLLSNMSFLFDIKIPPGYLDNSTEAIRVNVVDYSCGACTVTVDGVDRPIVKHKNSLSALSSSSSTHFNPQAITKFGSKEGTHDADSPGVYAATVVGLPVTKSTEWSDAVGVGGDPDLGTHGIEFNSDDAPNVIAGNYSRTRHSVSPALTSRKSMKSAASGSPPHYQNTSGGLRNQPTPPPRVSADSAVPQAATSTDPVVRYAVELYNGMWGFLAPYWVWDEMSKCLWKVKCQLSPVVASMNEPRRVVGFLSKRGNAVEAPRPSYFSDLEDSYDAKKLLLRKILSYMEDGYLCGQTSQAVFEDIATNYAIEFHHRAQYFQRRGDITTDSFSNFRNSVFDDYNADGGSPSNQQGDKDITDSSQDVDNDSAYSPMLVNSDSAPRGTIASLRRNVSDGNVDLSAAKTAPKRFNVLGALSLSRGLSESSTVPRDQSPDVSQSQSQLYLESSTKRRASVNSQMIAAAHSARLNEYKMKQQALAGEGSADLAMGPLEPVLAVDVFFPDILSIGSRAFGNPVHDSRSHPMSAPPPIHILRNQRACLLCTQTEILSYVLLPVALRLVESQQSEREENVSENSLRHCTIDNLISNLLLYFANLRTHEVPINVSLSLLLVNLLAFQKRFLDISHYVQLQFLTDSAELGMSILEMSDSVDDELKTYTCSPISGKRSQRLSRGHAQAISTRRDMIHAVSSMRQAGVDMLWRLNEKTAVVRWMLSHGRVSDAMILCTKTKGQWKNGLSPMGISGLDFFRSAMTELCHLREIGILSLNACTSLAVVTDKQSTSWKTSKFSRCQKQRGVVSIIDMEVLSAEQQGVKLMHAVYHFLNTWDQSLLTVQKVSQ